MNTWPHINTKKKKRFSDTKFIIFIFTTIKVMLTIN